MDTTRTFQRWMAEESGVTAIEYALMAALIAVALVGSLTATEISLSELYAYWSDAVIGAL